VIVVEHVARLARYTIAVFEAFLFLLGVLTLIFLLLVGPMARQGHAKDSQPKSSPAASKPIAANAEPPKRLKYPLKNQSRLQKYLHYNLSYQTRLKRSSPLNKLHRHGSSRYKPVFPLFLNYMLYKVFVH
jgi:hypothetical protein